jgi:hypothetical protein
LILNTNQDAASRDVLRRPTRGQAGRHLPAVKALIGRGLLGNFGTMAGALDDEPDTNSKLGEHIDERIGAEKIDSSPQQVADARLTYVKQLGRLGLLESTGGDRLLESDHQVAANQQVLGLLGCKAKVTKNVAARSLHPRLGAFFHF